MRHTPNCVSFSSTDPTTRGFAIAPHDLTQRDIHDALSFLAEVDATNPVRPFEPEAVALLSDLVGADRDACYYEVDHHTHATSHVAEHQVVEMPGDIETAHWALCGFYPLREKSIGTATKALALSNLGSSREHRRNPYVQEVMRPLGIADELKLFLPAPTGVSRVFDFTRGPGRPFDQQARGLLELLRPYLTRLRQRWERGTEPGGLTNREGEVVRLLATGMRNREIADHLTISVGTVRKHLNNIYEKLGVNTRTGAIAAATNQASPSSTNADRRVA